MKKRRLGSSDLRVSEICLGTMTWGTQNDEAEGHEQMDYALEHGINFWDTAEMYPVTPISAETQGRTEEIVGTWLAKNGKRDELVLATKATGNGPEHIRDGKGFVPGAVREACEGSLKRLQTDYIDIYQLHWPQRGSYHFRKHWDFDPTGQDTEESKSGILRVLQELNELVEEGKIRHIGLSNESAWGVMQFVSLAEKHDLPRPVSIQNEYSLICRYFDMDLAEACHHEDIALMAFSPLAAGLLTGKYADGTFPEGSRGSLNNQLGGRNVPWTHEAVAQYKSVADKHGLDITQMALAFCMARPVTTVPIIGATTMDQLKTNIGAADIVLSEAVLDDIASARRTCPMPI